MNQRGPQGDPDPSSSPPGSDPADPGTVGDAPDAWVRDALRALADPPLPADIAGRIDAALLAEFDLAGTPAFDDRAGVHGREPETVRPITPVRRRRRTRLLLAAAAVAGLVAVGGGLVAVVAVEPSSTVSNTSGDSGHLQAAASPVTSMSRVSGTSYTAARLTAQARALLAASPDPTAEKAAPERASSAQQDVRPAAVPVPAALLPLREPARLTGCLRALRIDGDTLVVDYARFDGQPALVVVATAPSTGRSDVVVAGAACGPSNPDELARTALAR